MERARHVETTFVVFYLWAMTTLITVTARDLERQKPTCNVNEGLYFDLLNSAYLILVV